MNDLVVTEVEDGIIDSYLDEDNAGIEKPTDQEWKDWLIARYDQIKSAYKGLLLAKREALLSGRHDLVSQIRGDASQSYMNRKAIVMELRAKFSEVINDPFIKA